MINPELNNAELMFCGGTMRSGTGIITKVLNTHPEMCMTSEFNLVVMWDKLLRIHCNQGNKLEGKKLQWKVFPVHEWHADLMKHVLNHGFMEATKELYKIKCKEYDKNPNTLRYFGDKWNGWYQGMDTINTYIPGTKILLIERKPRDIIASIYYADWGANRTIEFWIDHQIKATRLKNEAKYKYPHLYVMHYHRLQDDKEAMFKEVAEFLGIENNFDLSLIEPRSPRELPPDVDMMIQKSFAKAGLQC